MIIAFRLSISDIERFIKIYKVVLPKYHAGLVFSNTSVIFVDISNMPAVCEVEKLDEFVKNFLEQGAKNFIAYYKLDVEGVKDAYKLVKLFGHNFSGIHTYIHYSQEDIVSKEIASQIVSSEKKTMLGRD